MDNIGIDISKIPLETLTILARSTLPLGGSSSQKGYYDYRLVQQTI